MAENQQKLSNSTRFTDDEKTVIVLVGLPARGKTYIAKKLTSYLNWIGIITKVFNVGEYRRRAAGVYKNHEFFRMDNPETISLRKKVAEDAFNDLILWLKIEKNKIAVFDATNTTRDRRSLILEQCAKNKIKVVFVESICTDSRLVNDNILEVKVNNPDYVGMSKEEALSDFIDRIQHYETQYQPIDDELNKDLSYIKIYDQGTRYLINRIEGNIQSKIAFYLMNVKVGSRTIYLTRHGESELNVLGKIGGNAPLFPRGLEFAEKLAKFMESENQPNLRVFTSHLKRTIQTAEKIPCSHIERWKALDEIDAGVCDKLSYEEIQERYPIEFARRDADKYHYRYPMGESYQDLVARLEPVILELERQSCVLVICHQAVARCLLAFFEGVNKEQLPYIRVPLHTVFKLTPTAYRCIIERVDIQVPSVDTHRSKPSNIDVKRSSFEALQTVPPHY